MFLLLTLNTSHTSFCCFYCWILTSKCLMDSNTCYLFKDILQNNCFEKKVAGKHNVMKSLLFRIGRSQMFFKIGVLKNFASLTGWHLCWSLFLLKLQLHYKEVPTQLFSSEIWEILEEYLFSQRTSAECFSNFLERFKFSIFKGYRKGTLAWNVLMKQKTQKLSSKGVL